MGVELPLDGVDDPRRELFWNDKCLRTLAPLLDTEEMVTVSSSAAASSSSLFPSAMVEDNTSVRGL
jgi:hypothetical protein